MKRLDSLNSKGNCGAEGQEEKRQTKKKWHTKTICKGKRISKKRDHEAKSGIDAELHTDLQAQVQSAEGPCHFIKK